MASESFDFAPLLAPALPPPAAKWTGFPKYNFTGGNNDADHVPVDRLIAAATAVLAREGAVLIEQESYQGALTRLARLGVNAVGIPLDRDGMRTDAVAAALDDLKRRGIRAKYIYTIPTVQNPTGTILSEQRRHELLRLSEQHHVPIFEDDCYADLIWDGRRPPALYAMSTSGGVIHIGSFSKSIAPALRVGYIVARWDILSRILALKTDPGSGPLEQLVLAQLLASPFAAPLPKLPR